MPRQTKIELVDECSTVIKGLKGDLANIPEFTLNGKKYPRQDLIALFQSMIDAVNKTSAAEAAYVSTLAGERATFARLRPLRNAYRSYLESTLGKANPVLDVLGFGAVRPKEPTVEVKAKAVEKRRATRAARGTKGKKQKKDIKGVVPASNEKAKEKKP
jgi:hypothetical protein